ncbi:DUF6316 family protein [Spartinivicinus poritis]|uniref:DUF6316 family protein n=1 Tax=Spartinivicinus poritis TaxID=2994640 RepID=A0ABT5UGB0_9GAMM|nr:DUF6316 family protein [Spartinivicinus sp. A2-2]MDE1465431.1 DUF6316 family protein [Spartinivicinus sp. A2-2]
MNNPRSGELSYPGKRSDRFIFKENYWYFKTREDLNIGPFRSLDDAKKKVKDYLDFVSLASSSALQSYFSYMYDLRNHY